MALALDSSTTGPRALDRIRRAAGLARFATRSPIRCLDPSVAGWRSLHRGTGELPFGEGCTWSHGRQALDLVQWLDNPPLKYCPAVDNRDFPSDLQDGSEHLPSLARFPNCTVDSLEAHSLETCSYGCERSNRQFDNLSSLNVTFFSPSTDTIISRTKERKTCENESPNVCTNLRRIETAMGPDWRWSGTKRQTSRRRA